MNTLELTDPPGFYFTPEGIFGIFVMDDFGDAIRVPAAMYYAPQLFPCMMA